MQLQLMKELKLSMKVLGRTLDLESLSPILQEENKLFQIIMNLNEMQPLYQFCF